MSFDYFDLVLLSNQYYRWSMAVYVAGINSTICTNNQMIANMCSSSCGSIERDDPRAFRCLNYVGRKALTIVDVIKLNLFKLIHLGCN